MPQTPKWTGYATRPIFPHNNIRKVQTQFLEEKDVQITIEHGYYRNELSLLMTHWTVVFAICDLDVQISYESWYKQRFIPFICLLISHSSCSVLAQIYI